MQITLQRNYEANFRLWVDISRHYERSFLIQSLCLFPSIRGRQNLIDLLMIERRVLKMETILILNQIYRLIKILQNKNSRLDILIPPTLEIQLTFKCFMKSWNSKINTQRELLKNKSNQNNQNRLLQKETLKSWLKVQVSSIFKRWTNLSYQIQHLLFRSKSLKALTINVL